MLSKSNEDILILTRHLWRSNFFLMPSPIQGAVVLTDKEKELYLIYSNGETSHFEFAAVNSSKDFCF